MNLDKLFTLLLQFGPAGYDAIRDIMAFITRTVEALKEQQPTTPEHLAMIDAETDRLANEPQWRQ